MLQLQGRGPGRAVFPYTSPHRDIPQWALLQFCCDLDHSAAAQVEM